MDIIFWLCYLSFNSFNAMITTALLWFLWVIIRTLTEPFYLLDDVVVNVDIVNSVSWINDLISSVDFLLPVSTLIVIILLLVAMETTITSFKLVNWILKIIRG